MILWVASYPRSGNTFFRTVVHDQYGLPTHSVYSDAVLARLGASERVGVVPLPAPLERLRDDEAIHLVKTHEPPGDDDDPAIFVVRDGRDALVSAAHFNLTFQRLWWRRRLASRIVRLNELERTLENLIRSGDWNGWVLRWLDRRRGRTVVVRYEDLVRDPGASVQDTFRRLGIALRPVADALPDFGDFHARWPQFFRRGKIGSWRDEMPERLHLLFWKLHAPAMKELGYGDGAPRPLAVAPRGRVWGFRPVWERELERLPFGSADVNVEPSLSMASLGRHGLWGNCVLAYAFLKAFARHHGFAVETPVWPRSYLYDDHDPPITHRHRTAVLDELTAVFDDANHMGRTIAGLPTRAAALAARTGGPVYVLREPMLDTRPGLPFRNAELEGLFMMHTRLLAPHKEYVRSLFRQPTARVLAPLEAGLAKLRGLGRTVVGVHIRRGDFDTLYSQQGYEYVAPLAWYIEWLEEVWRREPDPVLLLCTNRGEAEKLQPQLARFKPVTSGDLGIELPADLHDFEVPLPNQNRRLRFFPDWFLLTHCDLLAASISTFSFSAAMMNERAREFVRPSYRRGRLVAFEPWNAQPLIFLPHRATLAGEFLQRVRLARRGVGGGTAGRDAAWVAREYRRILLQRAHACRAYEGRRGLARELLDPRFYLAARRLYENVGPDSAAFESP